MTTMSDSSFHPADWTLFACTLLVSLGIGVYYSVTGTKQKSPHEFFLAGRSLGALPIAMSIFMSYISAVLVLGNTAEMYTAGIQYWLACIGSSMAFVFSAIVLVPFFYKLNLTSSFEYFEARFKSKLVRVLSSVLFLISSSVYIGIVMFSPATALEAATSIPIWASILATGLVATIYTTLGGMRAVVWTDFVQGIILIVGVIIILVAGVLEVGGIKEVWQISERGGRLNMWNFDFNPTVRLTFWSVIVGRFFISLLTVGVGQTSVQRYNSAASLRQAQISALLNIPAIITVYTLTCLMGLTVYAYYEKKGCDPLADHQVKSANQLLPYFIMEVVNYPGIPGIFLATLVSGALSSLSSSLNSMAACTWKDIIEPAFHIANAGTKETIIKIIVFCYGGVAIGMAFLAAGMGGHVLQAVNSIVGGIGGPSLGIFILAVFIPWANWQGAFFGCIIGFAMTSWVSFGAYLSNPSRDTLPTNTDNCTVDDMTTAFYTMTTMMTSQTDVTTFNTSLTTQDTPADSATFALYRMSYMYNSAFGCVITVVTGIIISFITGATDPCSLDTGLVIPLCAKLCCCLSSRTRHSCYCGVKEVEDQQDDDSVSNVSCSQSKPSSETNLIGDTTYSTYKSTEENGCQDIKSNENKDINHTDIELKGHNNSGFSTRI